MERKYNIISEQRILFVIVFILIGILFYFSYQNKSSWNLQVDINNALLKKSPDIPIWRSQLKINEVVIERFHWLEKNGYELTPLLSQKIKDYMLPQKEEK